MNKLESAWINARIPETMGEVEKSTARFLSSQHMFLSLYHIVSLIVNCNIIFVERVLQSNYKTLDDSNHELHFCCFPPQYPTFPNLFILSLIIFSGSVLDNGDTKMNKTWSLTSLNSKCKIDSQWDLMDGIQRVQRKILDI